ncbi:2-dehydropantoate 2-reductase [Trinickia symbiotica]|uniref:2-dehydropantoate 2-reductase n=1 Tax=Trinickia symbiotica TaxID=863227 RepID=A0A2T3XYW3_9BURK|nr:ketopantoate reductase family protein [Trinickia symbiotica]PTB21681.1 2-dehydropantoate 2-reductase [Trinickia symbiotica]
MKIAVMGAGAVGCYYGGMLARAGHEVVLIGRAHHADAIRRDGLRFTKHDVEERIALAASTEASAAENAKLVLFCVKSTDTESAAVELQPYLLAGTVLLTLQNGVDNADRLRARLPHEIAAAVVYVATEMAGPGHVKHHGRGELVIEPSRSAAEIARTLIDAGIPTEISENVRGALWAKLILNCAYNAMSAIAQLPYGKLANCEGVHEVMHDVVAECLAVAQADGVTIPGDIDAAVRRIAETMPNQYSSTAQDLARGKRSEIDHLNGYVTRRGEAHGVATPANRVLHTLVKAIELKRSM